MMKTIDFTTPTWWDKWRLRVAISDAGNDPRKLLQLHDSWVRRFRQAPPSKKLRTLAEERMSL